MEREKPTREGRILKSIAYGEIIAGVGVVLVSGVSLVGLALIGAGGIKFAIIKRAEGNKSNQQTGV